MAKSYDIRLQPTRDQRRELDKAARAAGHRNTGPWALSTLLALVRAVEPAKAAPAPKNPPLRADLVETVVGRSDGKVGAEVKLVPRSPLTRSYDPDPT